MKLVLYLLLLLGVTICHAQNQQWTSQRATKWSIKQGWLVGCNYIPSNAVNAIEMWRAETFDTAIISKELKLASAVGMNTVRVFLHDLIYSKDSLGFLKRIEIFLALANRYGIKPLFVFFDSCWDPFPFDGAQADPIGYRHNSRWVQSPGYIALRDSSEYPRLERYVKAVLKKFAKDNRVLAWDIWNEPDYDNDGTYEKEELPNKNNYVAVLLKKAFDWARSENPIQPLTSPIWKIYKDWTPNHQLSKIEKIQIEESDIVSFHFYRNGKELEQRILWLMKFGKPVLCTEYLARSFGSTFEECLPIFKKYNVAAINWGLVAGKTNTIFPWDSWKIEYKNDPEIWHHDIFRGDGTPYNTEEVLLLRKLSKGN